MKVDPIILQYNQNSGGTSFLTYFNLNQLDLYRKERPFAGKNLTELGIAAASFMLGTFLHMRFDPFIRPEKKYKFELVALNNRIK